VEWRERSPANYEWKTINILHFFHACYVSHLSHSPTYFNLLSFGKMYKIKYEPRESTYVSFLHFLVSVSFL